MTHGGQQAEIKYSLVVVDDSLPGDRLELVAECVRIKTIISQGIAFIDPLKDSTISGQYSIEELKEIDRALREMLGGLTNLMTCFRKINERREVSFAI